MNIHEYESEVTLYAVEITKYLISRGSRSQDAEDAVQDTFVKMLELDIFIEPEKLRAWMYRVSIRTYIDKYRRAKCYAELMLKLQQDLPAFEEPDNLADSPNLKEFLKRLKPQEERLLHAYYYENKTTRDLSDITGHSLSKVKVDLYRARQKLKKFLEKEELKKW